MAHNESRWVDPAPLEVTRPRLPWWTMLPGWVKLVLSPVALVILLCWLGYQLGRVVYRYPFTVAVLVPAGGPTPGSARGGSPPSSPCCSA